MLFADGVSESISENTAGCNTECVPFSVATANNETYRKSRQAFNEDAFNNYLYTYNHLNPKVNQYLCVYAPFSLQGPVNKNIYSNILEVHTSIMT